MSKYSDTLSKVTEQVRAIERLENYPIAPSWVGAACAPLVNANPMFGYTTRLAEVVDTLDGKGDVIIDAALFAKHAGKQVVVDGKTVVVAAPPIKPTSETPKVK